jgi:hypothetical protein
MAVKQVSYYIASIPNKIGEGERVLKAVSKEGVSLLGFFGYPRAGRQAEVVLVVDSKAPNLVPIGKKAGLALGKKQKALFVKGKDRPGAAARIAHKLAAKGINIVSMHGLCAGPGTYGMLIAVDPADFRKAARAL